VLAPADHAPFFGDIASFRPGVRTVFGTATLDLSGLTALDVRKRVKTFFDPKTTNSERRVFVDRWCVNYIYCPDTTPVAPAVVKALRTASWLTKDASEGHAVLFRVDVDAG